MVIMLQVQLHHPMFSQQYGNISSLPPGCLQTSLMLLIISCITAFEHGFQLMSVFVLNQGSGEPSLNPDNGCKYLSCRLCKMNTMQMESSSPGTRSSAIHRKTALLFFSWCETPPSCSAQPLCSSTLKTKKVMSVGVTPPKPSDKEMQCKGKPSGKTNTYLVDIYLKPELCCDLHCFI